MMDKIQLMESVRVRRFIYDFNERDYTDRALKEIAWQEIASECGAPNCKVAKKEWKKIRDNFRDALKRYSKEHEKGKTIESYVYYNQIKFLTPFLTLKENNETMNTTTIETEFQSWSPEEDLTSNSNKNQEFEIEVLNELGSKKLILDPLLQTDKENEYEVKKIDIVDNSNHPIDSFFRAMSDATKRMPEKYQLKIKKQIFQIVHQYECEILDKNDENNSNTTN